MAYVLCADPCETCPARGLNEPLRRGIWRGIDLAGSPGIDDASVRAQVVGEAIMDALDTEGTQYRTSAVEPLAQAAMRIVDGGCPRDTVN